MRSHDRVNMSKADASRQGSPPASTNAAQWPDGDPAVPIFQDVCANRRRGYLRGRVDSRQHATMPADAGRIICRTELWEQTCHKCRPQNRGCDVS
jgi:hypothetical protein